MPDLLITDVSDALLEHLRRSAEQNGRTLDDEVVKRLEASLADVPTAPDAFPG
jgi:hypothetical protein